MTRPKLARRLGALAAVAVTAGPLAPAASAQDEPVPIPAFEELRFDEDWSTLALHERRIARDRWLSWKYAPLTSDRLTWFSVGGSVRLRAEGTKERSFGATPTGIVNEDAYLARLLLHGDLHVTRDARFFVELRSAFVTGRDSEVDDRAVDADSFDVQNAFFDASADFVPGVRGTVRVGRQELSIGSGRLVSPVDWNDVRTNFDAASLFLDAAGVEAVVWAANEVPKDTDGIDQGDTDTHFFGGHVRWYDDDVALQAYLMNLDRPSVTVAGESGDSQRTTVGIGANIPFLFGTRAEAEGAYQFGGVGDAEVRAFMYALSLERDLTSSVKLRGAVSYASGDDAAGDGRVGTFDQLYADTHRYHGIIDLVGGQNLVDFELGVDVRATSWLDLALTGHRLVRADKADTAYDVFGAPILTAPSGSRAIGDEIDVEARVRIAPFWTLQFGYGTLMAGDYAIDNGSDDVQFGYMSASFVF
ncbi:MAG: alginate export family protein [Planctomycetota bacterium]